MINVLDTKSDFIANTNDDKVIFEVIFLGGLTLLCYLCAKITCMKQTESLIGREAERRELEQSVASNRSELVIIYGRRRIGKTYLIEQHFKHTFDFWYVGVRNIPTRTQLKRFGRQLTKYSGATYKLNDWFDAFDALEEYLETLPADGKKIVFIDEMPWMDSSRSNFVVALEGFWNGWAMSRGDIMLIATGSATSWMRDKLLGNTGGLHSRITRQLHLQPFTLSETERYLQSLGIVWDRYQVLQSYMVMGGVPFYYSLLEPELSLVQNIDRLCFKTDGKLRIEFDELYNALFQHADTYIEVVRALSQHKNGLTNNDISKKIKCNGSMLSKILKNLERCDFIERWSQYGNKKRDEVFRLTDFYTLFYYKFIEPDNRHEEYWWSKNFDSPGVLSWMGTSFETVCLRHHRQIKQALGLTAISTETSNWHVKPNEQEQTPGAQIDMIIERADRIIHLCEIKFSVGEYIISQEYEKKLRHRMSLFQYHTKNKKSLVHTFITTYGVANGKNKSIVHSEVTMDDLFNS